MLKRIAFSLGLGLASAAMPQAADQAWLKYSRANGSCVVVPEHIRAVGNSILERSAVAELEGAQEVCWGPRSSRALSERARRAFAGETVVGTVAEIKEAFSDLPVPTDLKPGGYWLYSKRDGTHPLTVVAGADEAGIVYGTFATLRLPSSPDKVDPESHSLRSEPAMPIRWTNEWDNADGTVERGYGGRSIFFEGGKVRADLAPVSEYARLLASVGINGSNVNNVNNAASFLEPDMLKGLARIAEAMRPWGVRLAMSVDIASPQKIGGLHTYDPVDPKVKAWWAAKVDEIYKFIPDLAGFTVKADSEGQPGPASYGRTPADAANVLANALQPHGGVVLYRAFVYNHHLDWNDRKADRARAAYDIFHPLDGKFAENVIVQIKEAPSTSRRASPCRRCSPAWSRPTRPWNCRSRRNTSASSATSSTSRPCGNKSSISICAPATVRRR